MILRSTIYNNYDKIIISINQTDVPKMSHQRLWYGQSI